jgi:hypothetical protein
MEDNRQLAIGKLREATVRAKDWQKKLQIKDPQQAISN